MAKDKISGDPLALTPPQRTALLTAKAWWQEGDRQFDYLAERSRIQVLLTQAGTARDLLRSSPMPGAAELRPFLRIARTIGANSALGIARETTEFAHALHELFFGDAPLAERLTQFLMEVRGVGTLTTSQLLYVAFPDRYPFVTPVSRAVLASTNEQKKAARIEAGKRFGETDNLAILSLLTDFVLLDTVRQALSLPDFADLDGTLRHSREMPRGSAKRIRRGKSVTVQEESTSYVAAAPEPTEKELLRYLDGFVAAQGFTFPPLAVRNYYFTLKTKPFVILAGLSGTGKTRLTELIAEALTENLRAQYRLLPVRPDWSDPSPLLGYHNALTGNYIGTPFLDLIKEAGRIENRNRPYFVCLDEMNLSSPNHYLSDILSAMETSHKSVFLQGYGEIRLPPNFFISGTMNVDEGTHMIAKKVLDRTNMIEFVDVDFRRRVATQPHLVVLPDIPLPERQRLFLTSRVTSIQEAEARLAAVDASYPDYIIELLTEINEMLSPRNLHFAYRVRDEIMQYVANSFSLDQQGLLVEDVRENLQTALDFQIVQKVLPRITGTYEALDRLMGELKSWAERRNLPRAAVKLTRMRQRAREDGVVTFYDV